MEQDQVEKDREQEEVQDRAILTTTAFSLKGDLLEEAAVEGEGSGREEDLVPVEDQAGVKDGETGSGVNKKQLKKRKYYF